MKARLPVQEAVYFYQPEKPEKPEQPEQPQNKAAQRLEEVRGVAVGVGAAFHSLSQPDLGQTVGFCVGLPGFEKQETPPVEPFDQEVLLLKGFSQQRLNRLLAAFREGGVTPVAMKAVVTDLNRRWTLKQLFGELAREHHYMQQVTRLKALIRQGQTDGREEVKSQISCAQAVLASRPEQPEPLIEQIRLLEELFNREQSQ